MSSSYRALKRVCALASLPLLSILAISALVMSACGSDDGGGSPDSVTDTASSDVASTDTASTDATAGDAAADAPLADTAPETADSDPDSASPDSASGDLPFPASIEPQLVAALEQVREETGAPGLVVAVASDTRIWTTAVGRRTPDAASAPLNPAARFRVGTISMVFAAGTALRLVDAGDLALDDTLDLWLPNLPNATGIQISHLLSHASGLPNYFDELAAMDELGEPHAPSALLALAEAKPSTFAPGTDTAFSLTNTVALGTIIGAVTGGTYLEALDARVLQPNGMVQTYLEGNEVVPGGVTPGFSEVGGELIDVTGLVHPSNTWAAGAIATTAAEAIRVAQLFWGGEALSAALQTKVLTPVSLKGGQATNFALGCVVQGQGADQVIRHPGTAPGYSSQLLFLPESRLAIAVFANSDTANPASVAAEALVELLK